MAHLRVTSLSCLPFLFCSETVFLLFLHFSKKGSLLALVSEFTCRCLLRGRCSMEMWCPDDIVRDSWDWVGPPT